MLANKLHRSNSSTQIARKNIAVTDKLFLNEFKILLLMHLPVVRKITLQQINSQPERKILLMKHPQMAR
jgi:hypothetical protein